MLSGLQKHISDSDQNFTTAASLLTTSGMMNCPKTPGLNASSMRVIFTLYLGIPVTVIGLLSNTLAFVVLQRNKTRITTSIILQALAVIDGIYLISSNAYNLPVTFNQLGIMAMKSFNQKIPYLIMIGFPALYFIRLFGTWLTVLLTIDRHMAVCYPLEAYSRCTLARTYRNIVLLVVGSALFSLPRTVEFEIARTCAGFKRSNLHINFYYIVIYKMILYSLAQYIVPMTILISLNAKLLKELQRSSRTLRASARTSAGGGRSDRGGSSSDPAQVEVNYETFEVARKSVTRIVVAVVLVCIACNVLSVTTHLLYSLSVLPNSPTWAHLYKRITHASNFMVVINSSSNFFIYCLCSRNFRRECARILNCGRLRAFRGDVQSTMAGVTRFTTSDTLQPLHKHRASGTVDILGNESRKDHLIEMHGKPI